MPAGLKDKKGVTVVVVAISLVVIIGFAALAVDVGYFMVSRNQLQNAADAAALGAARALGNIYSPLPPATPMSYEDQQTYICNPADILPVAKEVAASNSAAGQPVIIQDADVEIGVWNTDTKTLTETLNQPNAVRVIARRDTTEGVGGQITTFFARIFGINAVSVTATATAGLTSQSTAEWLPPFGISRAWFENKENFCDNPIKFYPTNSPEGCAGWHTYEQSPPNANRLKNILNGLIAPPHTAPGGETQETYFEFIGGTIASVFDEMKLLFDTMRVLNDGKLDADENSNTWTTAVPVYDWPDCSNPNKNVKIVGFATVVIDQVLVTPEKTIMGKVICEYVDAGRGSGGNYGTRGSIPGLVE